MILANNGLGGVCLQRFLYNNPRLDNPKRSCYDKAWVDVWRLVKMDMEDIEKETKEYHDRVKECNERLVKISLDNKAYIHYVIDGGRKSFDDWLKGEG